MGLMGELKTASGVVFLLLLTVVVRGGVVGGAEERKQAGKEEYVVTLDHSNFTETVSKHDFIVVEFYAPWCGHCQHLAPEYEKAAAALSKHDPPITLSKVDASDESNKELAAEFKVQGFPTLKILRNGGKSVQEYKGPREADGIVAYLKKQLGPASATIDSVEDASKRIDLNAIFIAGVFPELSGSEYENYTKLAEKLRSDYEFGHTLDAKLLPRGASVEKPTIRILKPFDELSVDTQDFQIEAAEKFIEENTVPSLTFFDTDPRNQGYLVKYFDNDNDKAMLFLNFSSDKFAAFKSKMQDLATLFKGQGISFLIGDVGASKAAFEFYGMEEERAPVFVIHKNDDKKYIKDDLEPEKVAPWFKNYLDGKLEPFKKSQPIPETNDEPVKVVVADTLQDFVLDSDKNVLLEFYAPWCGHCKSLAPILDEIALSYQNDPDVVIAKFDATANDVPVDAPFNVQGFPTIYFKTAGGKIIDYSGHRTKEAIVQFIQDNRSDAAASKPTSTTTGKMDRSVKNEDDAGVQTPAAAADGDKPLKDEL